MNLAEFFEPAALKQAADDVNKAASRFPQICPNGLTYYHPDKPEAWTDKDYAMVLLCRRYFTQAVRTKIPTVNSYGLKHRIETHFIANGNHVYVHNGSCIVAAMALGFRVAPSNNLNALIGITAASMRGLNGFTEDVPNWNLQVRTLPWHCI